MVEAWLPDISIEHTLVQNFIITDHALNLQKIKLFKCILATLS
jgi:hypothetical protein